ncbi:hypothetical protein EZS27_001042 [termite gut metagenome]|uniref:CRISPR-associated protein Csh1 n=1 Tax=termite gut metagenome TaxID=433724 RepID=A0A5J4T005_9ZZZZ
MSLDTILRIGAKLRHSENNINYYRYIKKLKLPDIGSKTPIIYIEIPVNEDFSFDFKKIKEIPEKERDALYYLKYKTSDNDTSVAKYLFGDIYYVRKSKLDKDSRIIETGEFGNYILNKCSANSELFNGELNSVFDSYNLLKYWNAFNQNKQIMELVLQYAPIARKGFSSNSSNLVELYADYLIEESPEIVSKILKETKTEFTSEDKITISNYADFSVFIHFDFRGKQWYDYKDIVRNIADKLKEELVEVQEKNLLVPSKSIFRTLCSGNKKNDIQFPNFRTQNKYKSFSFTDESFEDFLYASRIIEKEGAYKLQGTKNVIIFVYPRGLNDDDIDVKDYEDFFTGKEEKKLVTDEHDFIFPISSNDRETRKFAAFDFVFSDCSGKTIIDLIELSGINESVYRNIQGEISKKNVEITIKKRNEWGKDVHGFKIPRSISNILGEANSRNHLLKIIPLIYTRNYYEDDRLLPAMIQKIEFLIRKASSKFDGLNQFNNLKYDLEFLMRIQNHTINKNYMKIKDSESYQAGLLLGDMAKVFAAWRNDCPIKSFEKNYVGNLTRRVITVSDVCKLKTDIEQKLIHHDRMKFYYKQSDKLSQKLKEIEESYHKEEFAFGFMESYFKSFSTEGSGENLDKNNEILTD